MKAVITNNVKNNITGYECIPVLYGKINLEDFANNSLEEIVAVDFLDYIESSTVDEYITQLCKKMRINSTLTLRGYELSLLCKNVINNSITSEDFNKIINELKSIHKAPDIINLLKAKNLFIETVTMKGMQYEIVAIRRVKI